MGSLEPKFNPLFLNVVLKVQTAQSTFSKEKIKLWAPLLIVINKH